MLPQLPAPPAILALMLVILAGTLEGLASGTKPRQRLKKLRKPSWSPPFGLWITIGVLYYAACFVTAWRLTQAGVPQGLRAVAASVLVGLMLTNAVWNGIFFRTRHFRLAWRVSAFYALLAFLLGALLYHIDRLAFWVLVPYLVYLVYGTWWVHAICRLNAGRRVA